MGAGQVSRLLQWLRDLAHAMRMVALRRRLDATLNSADAAEHRRVWAEYVELNNKRSPASAARMERARGLR